MSRLSPSSALNAHAGFDRDFGAARKQSKRKTLMSHAPMNKTE
jgi:hypothetical protein